MIKPILHLGPSKTASTSLQDIIPLLGRPYIIKPMWARALARLTTIDLPGRGDFPEGVLLSDEGLGDFTYLPPLTIAKRLLTLFGPSIVVYVHRESSERLRSLYNQALTNGVHYDTFEEFEALQRKAFKAERGHYVTQELDALRVAFAPHEFRVVQFNLLARDPRAFLKAFCDACGVPVPDVDLPHANRGKTEGGLQS
jgi:hypothetical protein